MTNRAEAKENSEDSLNPHEEQFVRAFVDAHQRERYLLFLGNPKHRHKVLDDLNHQVRLDMRYAQPIAPADQNASRVHAILTARGAPKVCRVMTSYTEFDARELELAIALDALIGSGFGTLISCIAGRLAYFEYEDAGLRYILLK